MIKKILLNRNTILVLAIVMGLAFNKGSEFLKHYNIYILAIVMTFSTTGIAMKGLLPVRRTLRRMGGSILLGYFIFSSVLLVLSWLLIGNKLLFFGMVVIAASPPGVAVIPFTHILKGDMNYTMVGTLGAYIAGVVLSPLIIYIFSGSSDLSPTQLLWVMVKIIVIPFMLSRVLLLKKIFPVVEKARGRVVDLGFALIIYTAVGLNRHVFFENFQVLGTITLIFFISMFVLGWLHRKVSRKMAISNPIMVSQNLLLTVKSSGFTASASLAIFGKDAAVPSAVLAVIVLVYLIYLSVRQTNKAVQ
jgi:BASS family bile acid:Na+ symporter